MKIDIYNLVGEVIEKMDLPKEIFGVKINQTLLAQAVRVYLANQRQGNADTKTRGEVNRTTKKVYAQKGTGMARHGSRRSPIYVGGGVAHGPHTKDYSLKMPQKMRRLALFSALSSKFEDKAMMCVDGLDKIKGKTKESWEILQKILKIKKTSMKILLIIPKKSEKLEQGMRNIKNLAIIKADLLNPYVVLNNEKIIIMKEAIEKIQSVFLKKTEPKPKLKDSKL